MRAKFILLIFILFLFEGFAQTSKAINGKITNKGLNVAKVDIVNLTTKKNTTTNMFGAFTIEANENDVLLILSEDYFDEKIALTKQDLRSKTLTIELSKKPINLEEVKILNSNKMDYKVSQGEIAIAKLERYETAPRVQGVYTGDMPYGTDFVGLFKDVVNFFKKKKKKENLEHATFKDYAISVFDTDTFFYQKLKIKPEELELFFSYCEMDPSNKKVMRNKNVFETLEFLISKNESFIKLSRETK